MVKRLTILKYPKSLRLQTLGDTLLLLINLILENFKETTN